MRRLFWKSLHRFAPPEMVIALRYRQVALASRRPAFPPRNTVVTAAVPAGPVLILAPHPDDEVIGPGGVLNLHLRNEDPVTVLYMTDGRGANFAETQLIEIRRREAKAIDATGRLHQRFWDIPDTRLTNDAITVTALTQLLGEIRPDRIYLPSFFDRHRDHFSANQILADALRHLAEVQPAIIGYEIWDTIPYPNLVVDVTETFEAKAEMMRQYQTPMQVTDFVALFRHRNALHYLMSVDSSDKQTEGYAEAFYQLPAATYVTLFAAYQSILREQHSPLARGEARAG